MKSTPFIPDPAERYRRYWATFRHQLQQHHFPDSWHGPEWKNDYFLVAGRKNLDRCCYTVKADASWVDYGLETEDRLKTQAIYQGQPQIEAAFGDALLWENRAQTKRPRIRYRLADGIATLPEAVWPPHQQRLIAAMQRLQQALKPFMP